MSDSHIEKAMQLIETSKVRHGKEEVTGWVRDDYVYMSLEGKVIRVGRKDWAALYTPVSPFISG